MGATNTVTIQQSQVIWASGQVLSVQFCPSVSQLEFCAWNSDKKVLNESVETHIEFAGVCLKKQMGNNSSLQNEDYIFVTFGEDCAVIICKFWLILVLPDW